MRPQAEASVEVVDVIEDFTRGMNGRVTPAEVRALLLDLIDDGLIGRGFGAEDEDLLHEASTVVLRVRGLRAARALEPGCGRGATPFELVPRKGKHPIDLRIRTGDKDWDKSLSRAGTSVAALLVFGARAPKRAEPLVVADIREDVEKLTRFGVGPKFGPGERVSVSDEALRKGIERLEGLVPIERETTKGDARRAGYYLGGAFPQISVLRGVVPTLDSWPRLCHAVRCLLDDTPFLVDGFEALRSGHTTP